MRGLLSARRAPAGRRRALGAIVLLTAVAAAYLGIAKPNPFAHDEVVHVMFDHVQDMALVQRDVRVAGVNVGTIGSVRRVGQHAEVDLLLHQHIPVYRDATAALRPHTPFEGTTFIDLRPGTPGAGPLRQVPIPISHTTVFVSIGDVISTFTAPVRRSFQTIVGELANALAPPAQLGVSTLLHNAPALTQQATVLLPAVRGPHLNELRRLLPPMAATVDALAGPGEELRSVVHNAARTLSAVAADDAVPLDRSLATLPLTLSNTTTAARRLIGVLDRAGHTASALIPALGEVPPTLGPLTPLMRRADGVLRAAPPLVSDFTRMLINFQRGAPALLRLFAALRPVNHLLSSSVLPAMEARTALGLPGYLQLLVAMSGYTGGLSGFVTSRQGELGASPAPLGHALRGPLQLPLSLPLEGLNSPIPCSAIAKLNPGAVTSLQSLGLCTP